MQNTFDFIIIIAFHAKRLKTWYHYYLNRLFFLCLSVSLISGSDLLCLVVSWWNWFFSNEISSNLFSIFFVVSSSSSLLFRYFGWYYTRLNLKGDKTKWFAICVITNLPNIFFFSTLFWSHWFGQKCLS